MKLLLEILTFISTQSVPPTTEVTSNKVCPMLSECNSV